jgi:uncharacterized integral membrane protein
MNKLHKVITLAVIGGVIAWIIWLIIYLANKTPAIEFDGPAGLVMIGSTLFGALIFGITGIILVIIKKF